MRRFGSVVLLLIGFGWPIYARHDAAVCGTTRDTGSEMLFLHSQAARARRLRTATSATTPAPNDRDIGIAIIEDSGGVVETLNQFNLDQSTVTFTPTAADASSYRFVTSGASYESTAASQGAPIVALGDDDAREVALPFAFPFFGNTYRKVWINSDGNLTFGAAENASTSRLTGRVTGGPPRIAPLFDDLDPSQTAGGVRAYSDGTHFVVSWVAVPEWEQFGVGLNQTFQVKLYPDGRIAFAYSGVQPASAVVGIAPGSAKGATTLISFKNDPSADYQAAIVERFGNTQEIDIVLVAQRFYQTHEDAYDYLVVYNNSSIPAMSGALAYESTVRSSGSGWGVAPSDNGTQYGSPSRLQSVLNMGPLTQYPLDPNVFVAARGLSNDTPLTILGHETGHLFMAYASIPDPADPTLHPMLGFGGVHWSFVFNSEASLDEGEQITDRGPAASPRFLTTAVTQHYSPLDQYLMGFRAPADVPDTFVVTGYNPQLVSAISHPAGGVAFDGTPLPITVGDIIKAEGRRTPDSTVAQRHYRFGFIMVVQTGTDPSAAQLQQVETYRQQFVDFYAKAGNGNASAETTLNRSLKLSVSPAAGLLAGATATVTATVQTAPRSDLALRIDTPQGVAQASASVHIPAGATSTAFTLTGVKSGVEELSVAPVDSTYETAVARVQVADASQARLATIDPTPESLTVRLTDINDLPYPGAAISATASAGSSVTPARAITDEQGRVAFHWTYGDASSAQLRLAAEAAPSVALTFNRGTAVPVIGAVVNAATFAAGIAPNSIATIYGANLDPAAKVTINGSPAQVFYASTTQINFLVSSETPLGTATIAAGAAQLEVPIVSEQAGIFAIVPHPGYVEIYATGLGATQVSNPFTITTQTPLIFFGTTPARPMFSGLAPGFPGLYQVNVAVPAGISGTVPVVLSIGKSVSNSVQVTLQ
jgi:uncharacterized protein (TIGR03437 family)